MRLFGREQLELANPCIRSVDDRQTYARIHFEDAKGKISAYVQAELQNASLFDVTLGGDSEAWERFNLFTREVGAYLTACVQSMHAVPDILANAVYYSLGLNLGPLKLPPRQVAAASVSRLLEQIPEATKLRTLFDALKGAGSSQHVSALANLAKHRSIVFPSLNEDWTGLRESRHLVAFPQFEYESKSFPRVFAEEFLGAEYRRCSEAVVEAGRELNHLLRARES